MIFFPVGERNPSPNSSRKDIQKKRMSHSQLVTRKDIQKKNDCLRWLPYGRKIPVIKKKCSELCRGGVKELIVNDRVGVVEGGRGRDATS